MCEILKQLDELLKNTKPGNYYSKHQALDYVHIRTNGVKEIYYGKHKYGDISTEGKLTLIKPSRFKLCSLCGTYKAIAKRVKHLKSK